VATESSRHIYLDACATSPTRPDVIARMAELQATVWGNPSSLHLEGLTSAEVLERSRLDLARGLGAAADEVIFTSGATESIHLALLGIARSLPNGRLVISAVEHPAVEGAARQLEREGWLVERWPVDRFGRIRMEHLDDLLQPPTRLVSLIWGQSEVGTLQPVDLVGRECRRRGIPFHVDGTQVLSQGRPSWADLHVDLLSASAHKCGGPKGVGLLLRRQALADQHEAIQLGGGQEGGWRAGTQPVAQIVGMVMALTNLDRWNNVSTPIDPQTSPPDDSVRARRDALLAMLRNHPQLRLTGQERERLPHHISFLICDQEGQPLSGRALVRELTTHGVSISSGSACASGRDGGSPVLAAMGLDPAWCRAGIRLSLGPWVEADDLVFIRDALHLALERLSSGQAERPAQYPPA